MGGKQDLPSCVLGYIWRPGFVFCDCLLELKARMMPLPWLITDRCDEGVQCNPPLLNTQLIKQAAAADHASSLSEGTSHLLGLHVLYKILLRLSYFHPRHQTHAPFMLIIFFGFFPKKEKKKPKRKGEFEMPWSKVPPWRISSARNRPGEEANFIQLGARIPSPSPLQRPTTSLAHLALSLVGPTAERRCGFSLSVSGVRTEYPEH